MFLLSASAAGLGWHKSSYSGAQSDCVEVAEVVPAMIVGAGWRKSSYSAQANDCVETGPLVLGGMAVRDSKDPDGPALMFPADAWAAFVGAVRGGEFPTG
ncbi:DUF397 domain-containing protein [Streptomyces sp. NRRL S-495]|nr:MULTISPECIES: DUF397 domain-containing protein [unclassified Streptomyces]KJY37480.1 hypothetical protein VR45_08825 [Streptomyces sp. NRRL S-495]KOV24175.1 hypothetical protein ADK60_23855 [Streptomyces sp. XY431]